jgi:hypothetical protein
MNDEQHKKYLEDKVNPYLEKMVLDLLIHKPEDVLKHMETWIRTKGSTFIRISIRSH